MIPQKILIYIPNLYSMLIEYLREKRQYLKSPYTRIKKKEFLETESERHDNEYIDEKDGKS